MRIDIPNWAEKLLADQQCPVCQRPYSVDDVSASGNRRKEGQLYYFYEVECPACKNPAMSVVRSRPCDSAQLAVFYMEFVKAKLDGAKSVNEEARDDESDQPSALPPDSDQISDEEVRTVHDLLKSCRSHLEFLYHIGATAEELKKYARPRK